MGDQQFTRFLVLTIIASTAFACKTRDFGENRESNLTIYGATDEPILAAQRSSVRFVVTYPNERFHVTMRENCSGVVYCEANSSPPTKSAWILSAAHCFDEANTKVAQIRFGDDKATEIFLNEDNSCTVKKVVVHPDFQSYEGERTTASGNHYKYTENLADLAIFNVQCEGDLELRGCLPLEARPLPTLRQSGQFFSGGYGILSRTGSDPDGYAQTRAFDKVEVAEDSSLSIPLHFASTARAISVHKKPPSWNLWEEEVAKNYTAVCKGDSGGPVVFQEIGSSRTHDGTSIVGINARSTCDQGDVNSVLTFSRIDGYRAWILENSR